MTAVKDLATVQLPRWLTTEQRKVVQAAQMVGWMVHLGSTKKSSLRIVSPDGRKNHHIGKPQGVDLKRVMRDVVRHGDPLKMALASASLDLPPEVGEATLQLMGEKADLRIVTDENPPPTGEERLLRATTPLPDGYTDVPDEVLEGGVRWPESSTVELIEPTIVSQGPMLAKAGDNEGYRSEHTIERKWSDGSTDYKCVRCDYTSTNRKSVPSHQQVHIRAGEERSGRPDRFKADVPDAVSYRPRESRVQALAQHLLEQFDGRTLSDGYVRDVAREALNWQHEQSRKGTEFAAETEEMSAEDMLARIRRMVASDAITRYEQRLAEQDQRLQFQAEQLAKADDLILEAQHKATRAQETLQSFIELAKGLDADE